MDGDIINNPQDNHHMGTSSLMNNCEIDWDGLFSSSCLNNLELEKGICGSEDYPMGDYDNVAVGGINLEGNIIGGKNNNSNNKYKGGKMVMSKRRNVMAPRIAFQTRSAEDVLDDGYRWRKYGQKAVKHSTHPRSYYRCTHHTCNVKKQIQRHSKDPTIVVTTYEGIHNHPSEKLMETLSPLLKQLQFLSGI
ncbi:probable WRKY transcription factor 24 [Benincasa hispida]|uniref:probable WRKY transcription factor 24 n=1 Tax=Benincasa hispida TaxID=102211 RepID=UPI001902B761|nr:probable WRKY transcription factor 24 [Benincasa hispida]